MLPRSFARLAVDHDGDRSRSTIRSPQGDLGPTGVRARLRTTINQAPPAINYPLRRPHLMGISPDRVTQTCHCQKVSSPGAGQLSRDWAAGFGSRPAFFIAYSSPTPQIVVPCYSRNRALCGGQNCREMARWVQAVMNRRPSKGNPSNWVQSMSGPTAWFEAGAGRGCRISPPPLHS